MTFQCKIGISIFFGFITRVIHSHPEIHGPKNSYETEPKSAIGTFQASLNGGICVPVDNPTVVSKSKTKFSNLTECFQLTHKSSKIISELVLKCTLATEEIHKSTLDLDGIFH